MNARSQPSYSQPSHSQSSYLQTHPWLKLGIAIAFTLILSGCNTFETQGNRTVTVLGAIEGELQKDFEQALEPFESATNIEIIYEGTTDFAAVLKEKVADGNPPDLAMFPQPGLMTEFATAGELVPLSTFLETGALQAAYSDAWIELGTVEEETYLIWYRTSVKSLVWYKPTVFETNAYEIPQTWAELTALTEHIVADGGTPWCIGLESGAATGWPGTDWIEDIMLRTAGPEAYSQWIDHRLPFNSPQVINAFDEFGRILLNPQYVEGGGAAAAATSFTEAADGLFTDPPSCYMHKQASFIESFFEEDQEPRSDYDIFTLPGIDEKFGTPILVAGDAFGMFNSTPEARALMAYLATPTPHEIQARLGGFISPHRQVSPEVYPNAVNQKVALILANADVIRFDGSDLMPGAVGTGSFWSGIIDFAKGKSAEEVTQEIDASWPQ